jgi:glucose/arabinose dehydrogenase
MKLIYLTLTLNLIIIQGCSFKANNSAPISPQPHQISTAVLNNQIHRLSTQELPPPFSSESASRSPQILPIPENATLKVPMGFKVSIFAENLDAPRWLGLTPTGEVLVTETRQNRIRLLKDTNQDGIADQYTTFAQSENGLDIPFGMAFTENNFFVANHNAVLKFPYQKGQESLTSKGEKIVEFYGWPFAYLKPQLLDPRQVVNNKSSNPVLAAQTKTPDVLFQAHSAALGLQFYDGKSFPNKYKNGAFVAFRGSWNRQEGTGYKVVFVPFGKNHRPLGYYEDFLTGFLTDPAIPSTWGRPVGLLVLPDGSLLITEEMNGRIYRVQFSH